MGQCVVHIFFSSFRRFVGVLLLTLILGIRSGWAATEDFMVEVWDVDAGLPDSTVTSLAQTPDGFLWVGTMHGGLSRFDGQRFVNFNPINTPELRSVEIQKLLVDSRGTLWIGTVEGALVSYRDGRFHFERQSTETPASWLAGVLSATSNSVVLSSYSGWLFEGATVNGTKRWVTHIATNSDNLVASCCDRQGTIWCRTPGNRLGRFSNHQFMNQPNPPGLRGKQIQALLTDAAGQLWVGTDKELARWNGDQFVNQTPTNGEPELNVLQMAACADGSLWVRTTNALRRCQGRQWVASATAWNGEAPQQSRSPLILNGDSRGGVWLLHNGDGLWHADATGRVSRVGKAQGLPNNQFECWFEDRDGNVWIGLDGAGLVCVRARIFHTVWPASDPGHQAARSICEDSTGTMWFGTSGSSVLRWRDGEFTGFTMSGGVAQNAIVFPGDAERLWVGNAGIGLFILDDGKFSRPVRPRDIGSAVRVIYRDHAGRVWIGSEFGLFCWDNGKLKRFTEADGFPPAYVLAITEDPAGSLWIGTAVGELRRYQNGKFTIYRPADSPMKLLEAAADVDPFQNRNRGALSGGERFWALHADAQGVIWIGSLGGGLLRFREGRFTRYTMRDGLPNEYINQILEDERGRLWLGTPTGIARVQKTELNRFARGAAEFVRVTTYDQTDGLPTAECSGGCQPACWRSRDGHLWFATTKGAVWVDPSDIPFDPFPAAAAMVGITVDGQPVGEAGQTSDRIEVRSPTRLTLSPGRHNLDFKFTAPNLTSPNRERFKWRLAGWEPDWIRDSSQRTASYGYLPPGNYEFQVQACNGDGVWNETIAAIPLTVLPHFWQTWWFKLGVGGAGLLSMLGMGLVIQRRRYRAKMQLLERQRAIDQERIRIARDIHDQVGANLTKIGMQTDMLRREPGLTTAAQPLIQGVAETTREMLQSMDEIVWAINPRNDNLKRAFNYLIHYTRDFLRPTGISYQWDMPAELPVLPLTTEIRHNLFMAYKEALNHAVKHAHPRRLRLVLVLERQQLKLAVEDDGCGFAPGTSQAGADGLDNMRQRLESVGGHCQVESAPGQGTRVIFQLTL